MTKPDPMGELEILQIFLMLIVLAEEEDGVSLVRTFPEGRSTWTVVCRDEDSSSEDLRFALGSIFARMDVPLDEIFAKLEKFASLKSRDRS